MHQVAERVRHSIGELAAEPTAPEPAPVQSDCRRLARAGANPPLLSAAPAHSIAAQPERAVLPRLSRSCEAFAGMASRTASSLNWPSASMAPQFRSTQTPSALCSASASQPDAPNWSRRGRMAPLQLAARPAWSLARLPTGPPSSAPQPQAALCRSKREGTAPLQLAARPAGTLARLPTGPPSSAPQPQAALCRSKRERTALSRLAPRPARSGARSPARRLGSAGPA